MKRFCTLLFLLMACSAQAQISGQDDANYNITDIGHGVGASLFAHKVLLQANGTLLTGHGNVVQRLFSDGTADTTFNKWNPPQTPIVYRLCFQQPDSFIIISKYSGLNYHNLIRIDKNGIYDPTFDTTLTFNQGVTAMAMQSDGKLLAGGFFTTVDNDSTFRLIRLLPNGQRDLTFNSGTGINSSQPMLSQGNVVKLVVDSLDRILMSGVLVDYNGQPVPNLIRLLPDGTLDTTFNFIPVNNFYVPQDIAIQNGKILVAGSLLTGGFHGLVRLLDNGNIDSTFNHLPQAGWNGGIVNFIHFLQDGRIAVAGNFIVHDGNPSFGVALLSQDGFTDTSFVSRKFNSYNLSCLASDQQGNLLVGGSFLRYGDAGKIGLVKIFPDGSPDYSFNFGYGFNYPYIYSVAIQPDGKHLVAGNFTAHNNFTSSGLVRIHPDGTTDTTFRFLGDLPNFHVVSTPQFLNAVPLSNGKILAANYYSKIIRLHNNGSIDSTFTAPQGYLNFGYFEVMPDQKIVAVCNSTNGYTIIRMLPDGNPDSTFVTGIFSTAPVRFAFQSDGKLVIAGGNQMDYTFNGSTYNGANVMRLNTNGTVDSTFSSAGLTVNGINTVNILSNGKILVGSNAGVLGSIGRVYRLMANGQPDPSFTTVPFGIVRSLVVQPDQKFVVGGIGNCFSSGTTCNNIVRVNENGTFDQAFLSATGSGYTGANALQAVSAMAMQSDWRLIVAGDFTAYNGKGRNGINRLMLADTICGLPPAGIQLSINGNTICQGDSITLYRVGGSLPPGGVYNWYSGSCGATLIGTGDSITVAPSAAGYIYVRTEGSCGVSVCTSTNINVLAFPDPVPSGDTLLCTGQTTTLSLSPNYSSYMWSNGSVNAAISVGTSGTYTVTVTNFNGCTGTNSWNVSVYPYPTVNITAGGPTSFCRGDSVVLSATAGLTTWQWYRNGNMWGSNSQNLVVYASGIYHCVGANIAGCADTSGTIQVTVPCMPVDPAQDRQEIDKESLVVLFPNPAAGILNILSPPGKITIYNTNGSVVFQRMHHHESLELDVSSFAEGVYLLKLESAGRVVLKRFLVNRNAVPE